MDREPHEPFSDELAVVFREAALQSYANSGEWRIKREMQQQLMAEFNLTPSQVEAYSQLGVLRAEAYMDSSLGEINSFQGDFNGNS